MVKVLAIDGTQSSVQVDPNHPVAHQRIQDPNDEGFDPEAIQAIFNPNVGRYEVVSTIGPAYDTRRQETFRAISQILQTNEQLTPVIGDLLFRAADFPLSDVIAERLHNMVPKQALSDGAPDPQVVQLQQQLAQQHQMMAQMSQELDQAKQKLQVENYKAETERLKAVGGIDPDALMPIIRQLVSDALGTSINPLIAAHKMENAAMQPQFVNPSQATQSNQ